MNNINIINTFRPGDIGKLITLHGEVYFEEYGYDCTFEAYVGEALSQFAKRRKPREKVWLVVCNDRVQGSIAICEVSDKEAQLRWFVIHPELRGRSLGKELTSAALSFAKSCRYEVIHLWTVKGLESARRIYLSQGFELVEEKEHYVWGSMRVEQKYIVKLAVHDN
jgi:ribosomal protein S18 acetylase RimI-like enzyme